MTNIAARVLLHSAVWSATSGGSFRIARASIGMPPGLVGRVRKSRHQSELSARQSELSAVLSESSDPAQILGQCTALMEKRYNHGRASLLYKTQVRREGRAGRAVDFRSSSESTSKMPRREAESSSAKLPPLVVPVRSVTSVHRMLTIEAPVRLRLSSFYWVPEGSLAGFVWVRF